MYDKQLVAEYEDILLGKRKDYTQEKVRLLSNPILCSEFFRYVFEGLLKWTEDDIPVFLTHELIKQLKLDRPLEKIPFPEQLSRESDLYYMQTLLYPQKYKRSKYDLILKTYQEVVDKKISRFPKNFFATYDGDDVLAICLRYIIERELPGLSLRELYLFFNCKEGEDFLSKFCLKAPSRTMYPSALDTLHGSLSDEEGSAFWYHFAIFHEELKNAYQKWRPRDSRKQSTRDVWEALGRCALRRTTSQDRLQKMSQEISFLQMKIKEVMENAGKDQ